MKKLAAFGALFLVMGMSSCKTYCPAYNFASVEVQKAPASDNAETTEAIKG